MLLAYSWFHDAGPAELLAKMPYSAAVVSLPKNVDVAVR
jgi:hypothetical protein